MATGKQFEAKARQFLRAELAKRDIKIKDLCALLQDRGCTESPAGLSVKINRGTFSFSFLLEICETIGAEINLDQIPNSN